LDYDFKKAFDNDFSLSLSNPPSLLTKDDNTLSIGYVLKEEAENFEVEAPPGLLGLVLETSEEGIPTVHMIQRSSPLAGHVRVGDRLLRVDGLDVSVVMWANDAARYVALKQNNPARLLVFARLRENDSSTQPTDPTDCGLEA
jgi:C-terminal processing protease CtpA/Prc